MRTTGKLITICATLGVAAVGLSGCATTSAIAAQAHSEPGLDEVFASQVAALADGVVSHAEYQAAFASYKGCMAESGYAVTVLNDEGTIIDMRIPAEAVDTGADDRCYQAEFKAVNEAWQLANQDQLADHAQLGVCLSDRGMPVPATREEKVEALLEAEVDLGECLSGSSAG